MSDLEKIKHVTLGESIEWCFKNWKTISGCFFGICVAFNYMADLVISAKDSEILIKNASIQTIRYVDSTRALTTKTLEKQEMRLDQNQDMISKQGQDIDHLKDILMMNK